MSKRNSVEQMWGQLVAGQGWVPVPKLLIRQLGALEINPTQFAILVLLMSYGKSGGKYKASPSKKTLADALGVSPDTIRKNIKILQTKGYITREFRKGAQSGKNNTNLYHFDGLEKALTLRAARAKVARKEAEQYHRKKKELLDGSTEALMLDEIELAKLTEAEKAEYERATRKPRKRRRTNAPF